MNGTLEISTIAAMQIPPVNIPESISLLAFGIGLIALVILIRWFLSRIDRQKPDDKIEDQI
ncbi:MAG: hypothetical protein ACKVQJ_15305 [Pyrinomonadaceae bacterium]